MKATHTLNGNGDLAFDGELRPYIGQRVEFVKTTKSGLVQIRTADGTLHSVPKRNLDELPPPVPLEEAAQILRLIATRSIVVQKAPNYHAVNRRYLTDHGWKFGVFNDGGEAGYLDSMTAPDGRSSDFHRWRGDDDDAPGMNPLDLISGSELKAFLAAIDWDGKAEASGDLFVSLGNMGQANIAHLRQVLDRGDETVMKNYEQLVEDFIQTFNHAVTQGVPPDWTLFAFTQAYAITLGACLRADLPFTEAAKFLRTIVENADLSNKFVRQVSIILDSGKPQ